MFSLQINFWPLSVVEGISSAALVVLERVVEK